MATSHPGPEDREAAALDALIGDTSTPEWSVGQRSPGFSTAWNTSHDNMSDA